MTLYTVSHNYGNPYKKWNIFFAVASRPTAGAGIAASCRQNTSTYAPIHATTREYIPARKFLTWKKFTYSNGTSSVQTNIQEEHSSKYIYL